jgi:hypothetical protein
MQRIRVNKLAVKPLLGRLHFWYSYGRMDDVNRRERFRGVLLGLATGDAVGTTLEFKPPGSFDLWLIFRSTKTQHLIPG